MRFFARQSNPNPTQMADAARPRLAELLSELRPERENDEVWVADVRPVHVASDAELRDAIQCHLRLASQGKRLALKNVATDFAALLETTRLNRMIEIRNILPPETSDAS